MLGILTHKDREKIMITGSAHDAYLKYLELRKISSPQHLDYLYYAAENNSGDAQNDVGILNDEKGNYSEACRYYKLAADKGILAAFYNLANCYINGGYSVGKNYAIAANYHHKLLTHIEHPPSYYWLSFLYLNGDANLPSNKENAKKYALKAIENSHAYQCYAHNILVEIYYTNHDIIKTCFHARQSILLKPKSPKMISFIESLKVDDSTQHEAYYHKTLAVENSLDNLFYTNHYITEYKEQQNWKYLKLFIEDTLLTHSQKRDLLKRFTLTSVFDNCKWQRLLPRDEDEIIKQQLYLYLYEIYEELKDSKFISPEMMPGKSLSVIKKNSASIFYQALEEARSSVDGIFAEVKNITGAEKNLLNRLSSWIRSIRDLHFFSDKKAMLLKEENLFIDHYQTLIAIKNPEISSAILEKITRVFDKLKKSENDLRNDYINHLDRSLRENKIELFKHIFLLRIAAKWSAAMSIYSHDIKRHDVTSERIEAGLGLVKGIISCIPIVGGVGEIFHSTGKIIHSFQSVSPAFEMITEGIDAIEAIKKGTHFIPDHFFTAEKKLSKLYANLGIHGPDYIDSFCQAICSRYEEQIQLMINDRNVAVFAEDTAKFVLDFLMTVTLTETEKNEFLAELLIMWCSKNYIGKGEKIKTINNDIFSGDLLGRTQLSCGYKEADGQISISLGLPHYLTSPPVPPVPPLSPRSYGQAKATRFEVKLFQEQRSYQTTILESKEPMRATPPTNIEAISCHFPTEAIQAHAHRLGFYTCTLHYDLPVRLLVKKQKEEIAELTTKMQRLEKLVQSGQHTLFAASPTSGLRSVTASSKFSQPGIP